MRRAVPHTPLTPRRRLEAASRRSGFGGTYGAHGTIFDWDREASRHRHGISVLLADATTPCWSKDGRLLATHLGVWHLGDDGTLSLLRPLEFGVQAVGFTPDGRKLICLQFAQDTTDRLDYDPDRLPDICATDLRTGRRTVLVKGACMASLSPDGRTLAFYRPRPANDGADVPWQNRRYLVDMWMYYTDSGVEFMVSAVSCRSARYAEPGPVEPPVWAPDGESVAFADQGRIGIIHRDGSGLRYFDVPFTPTFAERPGYSQPTALAWSDDGGELCFQGTELHYTSAGDHYPALVRMSAVDGKAVRMSPYIGVGMPQDMGVADWSPDRQMIAFRPTSEWHMPGRDLLYRPTVLPPSDTGELAGVWVARCDGTGLRELACLYEPGWRCQPDNPPSGQFKPTMRPRPAWSPDGSKIAVVDPSTPEKLRILFVER